LVAEACARAVEFVGLPEARLNLAHATLTLALSAKSNSATRALGEATAAVQRGGLVEVPDHLRDAHYAGAAREGFGRDYLYPHDFAGGWVDQTYLPAGLVGSHFYDPSPYGLERALVEQWRDRTRREDPDATGPPVE
jgi:putative ATPase